MKPTKWRTREGVEIDIKSMATPHLLSAIYMIERNRLNNLLSVAMSDSFTQEILDYYGQFPDAYIALCDEAERRMLIHRGSQKDGLVKRK